MNSNDDDIKRQESEIVHGTIVTDSFIVNSLSANTFILYLIALDVQQRYRGFVNPCKDDSRYVEVGKLVVRIHNSMFVSIGYTLHRGFGYKLPNIILKNDSTNSASSFLPPPRRAVKQASSSVVVDQPRNIVKCGRKSTTPVRTDDIMTIECCDDNAVTEKDSNNEAKLVTATAINALELDKLLYNNVTIVGEKIIEIMNDRTIKPQAYAIAQYLLLEGIDRDSLLKQFSKQGATAIVDKLLNCESDFLSTIPRSVGIDIVSYIAADKIQKSLDVKHIHVGTSAKSLDRIIPNIKPIILHTHPIFVWIRFYTPFDRVNIDANIIKVCEHVYEIYLEKNNKTIKSDISNTIATLEQTWDADIIFCSELSYFAYNKLLFISNYVKFTWCYSMNKNVFDPKTHNEIKSMCVYMMYGFLFLDTTNLTNMPQHTHNPLIAYTGERPRIAMNKFNNDTLYNVEGSRAMYSINKNSDFGNRSNFIEIVNTIKLPADLLSSSDIV